MDGNIARFENGKWDSYHIKDAIPGTIVKKPVEEPIQGMEKLLFGP
jgi:hypothetical protein